MILVAQTIPILSLLIFTPLLCALILLFVPGERTRFIKGFAFLASIISFLLSLLTLALFQGGEAFSLEEIYTWLPQIGISYHVGIDGISLPLVLLTAFIFPICILYSFGAISSQQKEYYILLLLTETALLGTFLSLDLILFFFFWEGVLIPMYLIIGIWGGGRRIYAAGKFVLFTVVGSLSMLLGIIGVFVYSGQFGNATFDFLKLRNVPIPPDIQLWLFLAFALAFAVKVPIWPLHTWLPDAHTEAPTAGSVILAGVLLKMGSYGLIRFNLGLFPSASIQLAEAFMALGVVGVIYGALVCAVQKDLKRLIAYSSIAHMGFIVLGSFSMNSIAQTGAVIQMVNHGISTGALFLLVGMLYDRRHTREISAFGGLAVPMPVYFNFFLIVMLSSIGLPALNGFVGEFLILLGGFKMNYYLAGVATFGVVLSAVYLLYAFKRVFFGECTAMENQNLKDLNLREILALVPIVLTIFFIGLYPRPFLRVIEPSAEAVVEKIGKASPTLYSDFFSGVIREAELGLQASETASNSLGS